MTVTITAFADPLDQGAGLARDMIVRWALEEVGQHYAVRLVPWLEFKEPMHRKLQPLGQISVVVKGRARVKRRSSLVRLKSADAACWPT